MSGRRGRLVLAWLWRHRWPIGVTLIALGLRLWWNLKLHPPEDHVFSDMGGYVRRAQRLVDSPLLRRPDESFYPVGTHYFIALFLGLFGSLRAAGVGMAVVSSLGAPLAYFLVGRLHGGPQWSARQHGPTDDDLDEDLADRHAMAATMARVAGLFIAIYFPLIGYTGFFLSEALFAVILVASAVLLLRLADHGRNGDAWTLGIVYAVGLMVRPQIMVAAGLVFLWIVLRRRDFPELGLHHLVRVVTPIALVVCYVLALSAYHSGRATPVAQNGGLNRAFGRCHAYEIRSYHSMFGPPAFGSLHRLEKRNPDSPLPLAPAIDGKLQTRGYVWDEGELNALADRCVEQSGPARQAYYAFTHVVLLWLFNGGWPDMGPYPVRGFMQGWTNAHLVVFVIPMLIGMSLGASRRRSRLGLVSLYAWSMFLTVMLVMGSVRFRVPYDIITIALALHVYALAAGRLTDWWARWREGTATEAS
jgi:hypothetical protein